MGVQWPGHPFRNREDWKDAQQRYVAEMAENETADSALERRQKAVMDMYRIELEASAL